MLLEQELRAAEFSDASLDRRIDGMRDELCEAQARNFAQWQILHEHIWPNPVRCQQQVFPLFDTMGPASC